MSDTIIEGRYKGKKLLANWTGGWCIDKVDILPEVQSYEIVDEKRRVGAGAGAAAAGIVLLGPIGLAAGLLGARKRRLGVIVWKNGEQSLLEIKSGILHKALIQASFRASN